MQKYFFPPGKHTNFHQGHKVFKAKGHMVIKARGQENLKPIFCTFYSSVSPFHPLLRHNIPNITNSMEIANCGSLTSFGSSLAIYNFIVWVHVFILTFCIECGYCLVGGGGLCVEYSPEDDSAVFHKFHRHMDQTTRWSWTLRKRAVRFHWWAFHSRKCWPRYAW